MAEAVITEGAAPTVTDVVLVQPLASLTVSVYEPVVIFANTLLAWNTVPLILYCNVPVPPEAVTVMDVVPPLHGMPGAVAEAVITAGCATVTGKFFVQLFPSLIVMVCKPPVVVKVTGLPLAAL